MKINVVQVFTYPKMEALLNRKNFWVWGFMLFWISIIPIEVAFAQTDTAAVITESEFTPGLSQAQINQFGDYSVREALARFSGVSILRNGEVNLRSAGTGRYAVTVDGVRLAGSGFDSRSTSLHGIPVDLIRNISVIKVPTPDMNPEALGGTINLSTTREISGERTVSAIAGGSANTSYINRTGAGSRFWLDYSERFLEELSASLTFSYQETQAVWEQLVTDYDLFDFGSGPVDVLERLSPGMEVTETDRFGFSINVNFTPAEDQSYFLRSFYNSSSSNEITHTETWQANSDWIDQNTTGAEGEIGSYRHDAADELFEVKQFSIQAGGRNQLNSSEINYQAGWSRSFTNSRNYLFPFQHDGVDYAVDFSDRQRPTMRITTDNSQILDDGTVNRIFIFGQNFERTIQEHIDDNLSARLDWKMSHSLGMVKAGLSSLLSFKKGEYDDKSFEYNRTLRMISFTNLREPIRNIDIFEGDYRIPWFIHTGDAILFLESQRPVFEDDPDLTRYQSEIRNYETTEQIYAGYAMGEVGFGNLSISGGARAEYTTGDYNGQEIAFNEEGEYSTSGDVNAGADNFMLFPNARVSFNEGSNHIMLAYSKTIARPDHFALVPFRRVDNQDSTIFTGNSELEPLRSNNFDLIYRFAFSDDGMISVGGFLKQIDNFVVSDNFLISGGSYDGYQYNSFVNSSASARVYGAEITLEKRFSFLPGVLGNFGTYATYTFSQSEYETSRGGNSDFPEQSPHVVNAALNYIQGRFQAQVSYHWTATYLTDLSAQRFIPSENSSEYFDRYEDGFEDLSVSARYQLAERFYAWASVYNILNQNPGAYRYDRDLYPESSYYREGVEIRLGIRFEL